MMPPVEKSASKWALMLALNLEEGKKDHQELYNAMKVCHFTVIIANMATQADFSIERSRHRIRRAAQGPSPEAQTRMSKHPRTLVVFPVHRSRLAPNYTNGRSKGWTIHQASLRSRHGERRQLGDSLVSVSHMPLSRCS